MPIATRTTTHWNTASTEPASPPSAAWTVGTVVGVPTGTSLTTRTSLGSPTSTGTYTLVDPTGRQPDSTIDVDIFEALEFYIAWCLLDGDAGGWTLQARGDNNPTQDNTNIRVRDTVILPGGFGSVDFVESSVALWERVYSDTYGGTPISNPAP